jgi:hypothetical protein
VFQNPDGTYHNTNTYFQVDNFIGNATFSSNLACTNIITGSTRAPTAKINSLSVTNGSFIDPSGSVIVYGNTNINIILGQLTANYISFNPPNTAIANYIAANNSSLLWQNSTNRSTPATPSSSVDKYVNLLGWRHVLRQTLSIPPVFDRNSLILTINTLINLFNSRGILVSVNDALPVITLITVTLTGFVVYWTGRVTTLYIDDRIYASNISGNSLTVTGFPNTNLFPYIIRVGSSDAISVPFPVSIYNINSDLNDMNNYVGITGLRPTSSLYFRLTTPNTPNVIILISDKNPIAYSAIFNISGSNASPATPIIFKFWDGFSYNISSIKITSQSSHTLTYNPLQGNFV